MIFNPPYRWRARPLANLSSCFWDVVRGVKNVWRWTPVIWSDYDWDWEPLARVMIFKLRKMEPVLRNGHLEGGERHAREVAICRTTLERLVADEYVEDAQRWSPDFTRAVMKADASRKADLDLLGKMLSRHILHWWD